MRNQPWGDGTPNECHNAYRYNTAYTILSRTILVKIIGLDCYLNTVIYDHYIFVRALTHCQPSVHTDLFSPASYFFSHSDL